MFMINQALVKDAVPCLPQLLLGAFRGFLFLLIFSNVHIIIMSACRDDVPRCVGRWGASLLPPRAPVYIEVGGCRGHRRSFRMSKGDQKRYGVNLKKGKGARGTGKKMLPESKPKPMTVDEIKFELKQKKQRQRGPRVRGRKAVT